MDVNWPQALQDSGPFALLPFVGIVVERIAAKRAHDNQLPERVRNTVYATAWIMIFLLCGAVVTFWGLDRPKAKEAMMRGKITGLGLHQQLRGTGPEAENVRVFTYRDPQQTDQVFWRTFSTDPLDAQAELAFLIDSSTQNSDDTWRYPFHANRKFYDASVELRFRYDPNKKGRLLFDDPNVAKPEELEGKQIVVAAETRGSAPWRIPLFGSVFAQARVSAETAIANLEADDPVIRLTARRQLASLGPQAINSMEMILTKPDSSYRAKLGVIIAANQMSGFRPDSFSRSAWCAIWRSAQTDDNAMKAQANLLLSKQSNPISASSCAGIQAREPKRKSTRAPKR
jgi:hypothetical protein